MKRKNNLPIIMGHIVECFDITLYGFFAVKLAPVFFPPASEGFQTLESFGAFSAGFLMRPLGALFFGYLGDKIGRRIPLLLTMILVAIPTLMMGLLPTYEEVGILSTILLFGCRLFQGFFYGGEFAGASLYIMETLEKKFLGKYTGRLISWGVIGAALATALGTLVTLDRMPCWGWRIPFIVGGIAAFGVYLLRRNIFETPEFKDIKSENLYKEFPWKTLLRSYKKLLFLGFLIFGLTIMPLYMTTIFGNTIFKSLGYNTAQSMALNMGVMLLVALTIAISGYIADKVGYYNLLVRGMALTAIVTLPCFFLISSPRISFLELLIFVTVINIAGSIISACASIYVGNCFPTHCRYSGLAFCVTMGAAFIGGTTPWISQVLQNYFHSLMAPGFFLTGFSLLTLSTLTIIHKKISILNSSHYNKS